MISKYAARLILLVLIVFAGGELRGQSLIQPPGLQCIKNDTLFWTLPVNTCGPFQNYLIFGSTSPAGPFNLITTIPNQNQTNFFHAAAGTQVWYYYMQSNHACPGAIRLSSDTLSSNPPQVIPIRSASVISGQVVLTWTASSDPQVDRYIIYRTTSNGTVPVDTVFGTTTWTDPGASPGTGSEFYYVLAADPCGNTSLFDVAHQTIFVQATVDPCARTLTLTWNPYINWPGGVGEQMIWLALNGQPALPMDTISGAATQYTFMNADDADSYCFTIRAREAGTNNIARSNEICLDPDLIQPPRQMAITFITVNTAQEPELEWVWEDYAELNLASVDRQNAAGQFQPVQPIAVTPPLLFKNSYQDAGTNASLQRQIYRISAVDQCDDDWVTEPAAAAFLQAAALPNFQNTLSWSPLWIDQATIEEHEIFEVRGSLILPLGTTDATTFTFDHLLDPSNPPLAPICYVVETTYTIDLPGGTQERRFSRSNIDCASQELRIWIPNAFAPRGLNHLFRPVISFLDGGQYTMDIYNRWGERVFSTTDPGIGWDGKQSGGKDAAPGVYVYLIRVVGSDGTETTRTGSLTLLR
ncbi:MAG: gliding motility-associated C-terminal domain-containing protein [Saprospiraceae bacterium]|nr:gliding motility-associated C-terminal domain-containing protein [Saprospiraceae bacterium]